MHSSNGSEARRGTGRRYGEGEYDSGGEDETRIMKINDSYTASVCNSIVNQTRGHGELYGAQAAGNDDSMEKSRVTQQRLNASEMSQNKYQFFAEGDSEYSSILGVRVVGPSGNILSQDSLMTSMLSAKSAAGNPGNVIDDFSSAGGGDSSL